MFPLPEATQLREQQKNDRQLTRCERNFERKGRLMDRCYSTEEKLSARWIGAGDIRVVKRAGLGCVQGAESRVVGNDNVRVIAEPLDAAIPNISMDVII